MFCIFAVRYKSDCVPKAFGGHVLLESEQPYGEVRGSFELWHTSVFGHCDDGRSSDNVNRVVMVDE